MGVIGKITELFSPNIGKDDFEVSQRWQADGTTWTQQQQLHHNNIKDTVRQQSATATGHVIFRTYPTELRISRQVNGSHASNQIKFVLAPMLEALEPIVQAPTDQFMTELLVQYMQHLAYLCVAAAPIQVAQAKEIKIETSGTCHMYNAIVKHHLCQQSRQGLYFKVALSQYRLFALYDTDAYFSMIFESLERNLGLKWVLKTAHFQVARGAKLPFVGLLSNVALCLHPELTLYVNGMRIIEGKTTCTILGKDLLSGGDEKSIFCKMGEPVEDRQLYVQYQIKPRGSGKLYNLPLLRDNDCSQGNAESQFDMIAATLVKQKGSARELFGI